MSIGLKRGTAAVEPHSAEWESSAREKIRILRDILKDDLIDAQHIGSTSVPSICAKPIVDIAVGVLRFEDLFLHNAALAEAGFVYRREDHPGQHLYVCRDAESEIQTHFIHAVIHDSETWNNYVNMRDYLNSHEDRAREYAALKERLAAEHPGDRNAYTSGKSAMIEDILRDAAAWRSTLLPL